MYRLFVALVGFVVPVVSWFNRARSIPPRSSSQPGGDVGAQVDAQRPPAALREHLEVAARLRGLDRRRRCSAARALEVLRVVARDLQEDAAVRAALVRLTGGVQEARAEAQARGDVLLSRTRVREAPATPPRWRPSSDVGQHREVVARACATEMRLQERRQRSRAAPTALRSASALAASANSLMPVPFEERRLGRQRARLLVLVGQRARGDLAGLDVGLVERVDAEDRARDRPSRSPSGRTPPPGRRWSATRMRHDGCPAFSSAATAASCAASGASSSRT